jgi:hypothetical protein
LGLDPQNAEAMIGRGRVWWYTKGDRDRARADFDAAKVAAPDNPHAVACSAEAKDAFMTPTSFLFDDTKQPEC